jgi:Lon protease-like protein
MAKACLKDGTPFGVCAIREGKEVGTPAVPFEIGTTAKIAEWDMQQLGVLQIVAIGEARFRILEQHARKDGLLVGRVEMLSAETDGPIPAACEPAVRLPLPLAAKQELLQLDDARVRLERVNALLRASAREES